MAVTRFSQFFGELPRLNPRRLSAGYARIARNYHNLHGALTPLKAPSVERARTTLSTPESLFRYTDTTWCEWSMPVDVVRSIVPNDAFDRLYYSGQDYPRVTDNARISDGSGGPYPAASLRLGVPAPSAPTVSVTGTATDPNDLAETRFYRITYVNSYGEEGPPSAASPEVELRPGQAVSVGLPGAPAGNYVIEKIRIYRTNGNQYQFVAETLVSTASYSDPAGSAVYEPLPSTEWDPPPEELQGLIAVAGTYFAGFRKNELLFSEDGLPHAWPALYRRPLDHKIVGLGAFGTTLVVCTEGVPYALTGSTASALMTQELPLRQACVSKAGILSMGTGVVYPSPDGLVMVGEQGSGVVTQAVITPEQWRTRINPASLKAVRWEQYYIGFYTANGVSGAFIFNPETPEAGLLFVDAPAVAARVSDLKNDAMFFASGADILRWEAGAPRTLTYESAPLELATPEVMGVAQVFAERYPVQVSVYADGVLQAATRVNSDAPVRLGARRRARLYAVRVEGTGEITDIVLASTMQELKEV